MKFNIACLIMFMFALSAFGQNFSPDWQKVPASFKGNDFELIYSTLISSKSNKGKDEFETTAQYNERINNPGKISIGGNLTVADTLYFIYKPDESFSISGTTSSYNADEQVLEVEIRASRVDALVYDSKGNSDIKQFVATSAKPGDFKEDGAYTGSNSFGVQKEVKKYRANRFSLAINNIDSFQGSQKSYLRTIVVPIKLPPAEAKTLKQNLAVLFVVKLLTPYFGIDGTKTKPTIDKPTEIQSYHKFLIGDVSEIWLFDGTSGTVHAKLKARQ